MDEFPCRVIEFIRCGMPMMRENIGDAIDYPMCEACQEKHIGVITRFDNGRHS